MSSLFLDQKGGTACPIDLPVTINSLSPYYADIGNLWTITLGLGSYLDTYNVSGGVAFYAPGGYSAYFLPNGSGGFLNLPGLDATVVKNNDGSYTLTWQTTGERYTFGANLIDRAALPTPRT